MLLIYNFPKQMHCLIMLGLDSFKGLFMLSLLPPPDFHFYQIGELSQNRHK